MYAGWGGREKQERRESASRELSWAGPGRKGLSRAVRSESSRPAHRGWGAEPRRRSPWIGRRKGVRLGRYQQSRAAEAGGGCGTAGLAPGEVAREWPGQGWAGAAVAAAGGGERGVGLPLPGGGGGGRGRAAPHRAGGHGASLGPCR